MKIEQELVARLMDSADEVVIFTFQQRFADTDNGNAFCPKCEHLFSCRYEAQMLQGICEYLCLDCVEDDAGTHLSVSASAFTLPAMPLGAHLAGMFN